MRHYLPSVAAAMIFSKDQRDCVGRWHVNFHQSVGYIHTSRQIVVVVQVQWQVNRSLCECDPGYDESELWDEFATFLKARGEEADGMVAHHRIFKWGTKGQRAKGPFLGGIWPTMDEVGLEGVQQDRSVVRPVLPVDQGNWLLIGQLAGLHCKSEAG